MAEPKIESPKITEPKTTEKLVERPKTELPEIRYEQENGFFRVVHVSPDWKKLGLPLNLENAEQAVEVAKFVRGMVITKETCLSLIKHSTSCRIRAEGSANGGMGSSRIFINDDGIVPGHKITEALTGKPAEEMKMQNYLDRAFEMNHSFGDGYAVRKLLGNPNNAETIRILEASAGNAGKTFAAVIAEFANAIPVKPFPKTDVKAK